MSLTPEEKSRIRQFVEIYYDVQDVRIRSINRLRQVGEVQGVKPTVLKELEKQIREYIQVQIKGKAVTVYLRGVKGIGPILAGGIMAYFDVHKADHISGFWKYAGLHVVDGHGVKRKHGQKLEFNPHVKVLCWKIGDSFIKQRTPFYRDIYDTAKAEYNKRFNNAAENAENCPNYAECVKRLKKSTTPACKMHMHYMAMRKMVKRFLADLWVFWRQSEGLPVTPPYSHKDDYDSEPLSEASHAGLETHRERASHICERAT